MSDRERLLPPDGSPKWDIYDLEATEVEGTEWLTETWIMQVSDDKGILFGIQVVGGTLKEPHSLRLRKRVGACEHEVHAMMKPIADTLRYLLKQHEADTYES